MKQYYLITLFFLSPLIFATNGSYTIGQSPVSKSMGGTGVANFTNTVDAGFKNPALLSEMPKAGGGDAEAFFTLFKENATGENLTTPVGGTAVDSGQISSQAGAIILPMIGAGYKFSDQ